MTRVFNFSAGPAAIPDAVLERVRADIPDWNGTGMTVMEISHRSKPFMAIAEKAEQDFRELLDIPADYSVLFTQGGATMQFSMVPLNLAGPDDTADYIVTGTWSQKAVQEAENHCHVNIAADASPENFTGIPTPDSWQCSDNAAYLHYTPNETIHGVEFHYIPDSGDTPLVADMSSSILSRPLDVSRFGVIYAGAQKNIGPAGLTIVIVRNDLLSRGRPVMPKLLRYSVYAESGSLSNTPPVFSWYVAGLVFEYLKEQGGLAVMAKLNQRKAEKLYAAIDASDFYSNNVDPDCRSWMNVPFSLKDSTLDGKFLEESTAAGLAFLKGHRSVGGMRASIYNAVPEAAIDALAEFMGDFERANG